MLCWTQSECKTKFKFVTESYSWEFLTAIKTEHDARPTYLLNNRSISWLPIIRHTYCSILKLLNNFVAERHAPSQHGSNNTHCSQLQKPNKIDRFWCLIEFVSTFGGLFSLTNIYKEDRWERKQFASYSEAFVWFDWFDGAPFDNWWYRDVELTFCTPS